MNKGVICGALTRRAEILGLLRNLPHAPVVDHEEVLHFIDAQALVGSGLLGRAYWTFQFWLEHAAYQSATTAQRVRLWQILHWRDRPVAGAPRQPPAREKNDQGELRPDPAGGRG